MFSEKERKKAFDQGLSDVLEIAIKRFRKSEYMDLMLTCEEHAKGFERTLQSIKSGKILKGNDDG